MLLEIYEPTPTVHRVPGESPEAESTPAPRRPTGIEGETVAVVTNEWKSMDILSHAIEDRLRELGAKDVQLVSIPYNRDAVGATQAATPELLDEIAGNATAALVGLGN
jgi:hypothetical protein